MSLALLTVEVTIRADGHHQCRLSVPDGQPFHESVSWVREAIKVLEGQVADAHLCPAMGRGGDGS